MKPLWSTLIGTLSLLLVLAGSAVGVRAAQLGYLTVGERSVTEAAWTFDLGCQHGCVGLQEWWELVGGDIATRGRVVAALFLAYDATAGWRPAARTAVRNRTPILTVDLDAVGHGNAIGLYIRDANVILLEDELLGDALDVLAAVAAHEVVHAARLKPGLRGWLFRSDASHGRGACLEEEYEAIKGEIAVFSATPSMDHAPDSFGWEIVRRREAQQTGRLLAVVAELYADRCGFV